MQTAKQREMLFLQSTQLFEGIRYMRMLFYLNDECQLLLKMFIKYMFLFLDFILTLFDLAHIIYHIDENRFEVLIWITI